MSDQPRTEAGRSVVALLRMRNVATLDTAEWPDVNAAILAIEAEILSADRIAAALEWAAHDQRWCRSSNMWHSIAHPEDDADYELQTIAANAIMSAFKVIR